MGRAEKDCASMAKYLHEKCVGTGHERPFCLCVLDGAPRSAFPHLEKKIPWRIWCSCHIISLFFKNCFGSEKGVPELVEALQAKAQRAPYVHNNRSTDRLRFCFLFFCEKTGPMFLFLCCLALALWGVGWVGVVGGL
jgi:hypothetical protein